MPDRLLILWTFFFRKWEIHFCAQQNQASIFFSFVKGTMAFHTLISHHCVKKFHSIDRCWHTLEAWMLIWISMCCKEYHRRQRRINIIIEISLFRRSLLWGPFFFRPSPAGQTEHLLRLGIFCLLCQIRDDAVSKNWMDKYHSCYAVMWFPLCRFRNLNNTKWL